VKRAKSEIICTSFFQFNEAADDINDIDPAEDLLYGCLGNHCLQIYGVGSRESGVGSLGYMSD